MRKFDGDIPLSPYDKANLDPAFDEYVLNGLIGTENLQQMEKREAFRNFVTNEMFEMDMSYDFDNGEDEDLFKTFGEDSVDLDKYSTRIVRKGIDLEGYVD